MSENKKILLSEILNNENNINILFDFFRNIYYNNDIMALTGINCFNYEFSEIEIIDIIKAINENNLNVILKDNF